jgi:Na+/proline symporter
MPIPEQTDNLYPELALNHLGLATGTFFLIGIAAAAYSSADSSLTGLTTSFCVDLMNFDAEDNNRKWLRHSVHFGFSVLIFILIIVFKQINNESVLYAFIRTIGFIYGPLLGVYIFGFYSKRSVKDVYIPVICILSPVLSFIIDINSEQWLNGYEFGYDILLLNLALALLALFLLSKKNTKNEPDSSIQ